VERATAASPLVAGYLDLRVGGAQAKGVSIESFTYAPVDGKRVPVVLTAGAMPNAPGQITLAPTTARELGVGVGSQLQLTGGPQPRTMTVSASDSSRPARTTTMTRARGSPGRVRPAVPRRAIAFKFRMSQEGGAQRLPPSVIRTAR
jgi:hypothetical protein